MDDMEVKPDPAIEESVPACKPEEGEPVKPDTEVVMARLREVLKTANLETTTEKMLRKSLEEEFKADLTDLKSAIRSEIEAYLDTQEVEEKEEEQQPVKKRKAGGGFSKLCNLSPALSAFLGVEKEARPQVVKKLWDYIKANNLQDPKDKRKIRVDDKLRPIFPNNITMFSMNKQLTKHILRDDEAAPSGGGSSKKRAKDDSDDDNDGDSASDDDDNDGEEDDGDADYRKPSKKSSAKKAKGGGGGGGGGSPFTRPMKLSPQLADLVGATEMSRPELTKFFSNYCKEQGLLDPKDKRVVLSNDVLKSLFNVDSFRSFGEIQRLLKPHLLGGADM